MASKHFQKIGTNSFCGKFMHLVNLTRERADHNAQLADPLHNQFRENPIFPRIKCAN